MSSAEALEPEIAGTHMKAQGGASLRFSHSLAVSRKAWLKVHCSRANPKDCDGRGERLHKKNEKGAYRLVTCTLLVHPVL